MRIKLKDDSLFAIAALWEAWRKPDGSCTAITTEPNGVEPIHDRIPVILWKRDEAAWLDPKNEDIHFLGNMLKPFDEEQMEAYIVSSNVNSPKNNEESLIIPIC